MKKSLNEKIREYNRRNTKRTVKDIVFDELRDLGYTVNDWDDVKALVEEYGNDPVSYYTGKPYTGVNRLLLDTGAYLTWSQIQKVGGIVKKGAKSKIVVYCSATKSGASTVLKYYRVFDSYDVDGIPHVDINEEPELDEDRELPW